MDKSRDYFRNIKKSKYKDLNENQISRAEIKKLKVKGLKCKLHLF